MLFYIIYFKYNIILYYILYIYYPIVLYYIILNYIILWYYTLLYYIILYWVTLYYIILLLLLLLLSWLLIYIYIPAASKTFFCLVVTKKTGLCWKKTGCHEMAKLSICKNRGQPLSKFSFPLRVCKGSLGVSH